MNRKALLSFSRLEALKQGIQIEVAITPKNDEYIEVEKISVPRMIDVNGNRYTLVNVNKYLEIEGVTEERVIVEVIAEGVIENALLQWLKSKRIKWYKELAGGDSNENSS